MSINTPFITDKEQLNLLDKRNHGAMKYTLMNDFLSKYSFQKDLYALKGLIAAFLHLEPDEITSLTILNPVEPGNEISDKECILDLNIEINNTKLVNVEIQARYQDFWPERSITYLCRNFDHLKAGESYNLIKPCIQIGILNHDLFKKDDARYTGEFYSEYRLLNTTKHTDYSSKFEIKVLSLNQLENASEADKQNRNGLYHWAKMFVASSWEELKMVAQDNPMMSSFVGTVMQLTAEEKVAQACEARRRYSNDVATYEEMIATREAILAEKDEAIAEKDKTLAEKDKTLAEKDKTLAEKDKTLAEKEKILAEKDEEIDKLKKQLAQLDGGK